VERLWLSCTDQHSKIWHKWGRSYPHSVLKIGICYQCSKRRFHIVHFWKVLFANVLLRGDKIPSNPIRRILCIVHHYFAVLSIPFAVLVERHQHQCWKVWQIFSWPGLVVWNHRIAVQTRQLASVIQQHTLFLYQKFIISTQFVKIGEMRQIAPQRAADYPLAFTLRVTVRLVGGPLRGPHWSSAARI